MKIIQIINAPFTEEVFSEETDTWRTHTFFSIFGLGDDGMLYEYEKGKWNQQHNNPVSNL